jgi:hypothetical protein
VGEGDDAMPMKLQTHQIVRAMTVALACATAAVAIPMRIGPAPSVSTPQLPNAPETNLPGGITGEIDDMLHGAERLRQRDPIKALTGNMDGIIDDLDQQQTGVPVQTEQKQVVSQLDKLIEELNKQCNGNGGVTNNPTKPMADSKIAKGPGGSGPMHDPQAGVKSWGQLPAKERDKILQSQNDGFPTGYEAILSSYYNRLAQEQVGDDGKPAAMPATQP